MRKIISSSITDFHLNASGRFYFHSALFSFFPLAHYANEPLHKTLSMNCDMEVIMHVCVCNSVCVCVRMQVHCTCTISMKAKCKCVFVSSAADELCGN